MAGYCEEGAGCGFQNDLSDWSELHSLLVCESTWLRFTLGESNLHSAHDEGDSVVIIDDSVYILHVREMAP